MSRWRTFLAFLWHERTRYVLAWLVTLGAAGYFLHYCWTFWDDPDRKDGNRGHVTIDFGGQYLAARMLVAGEGWHLYDRRKHREVLTAVYLPEDEYPPRAMAQRVGSTVLPLGAGSAIGVAALLPWGLEKHWSKENLEKVHYRGDVKTLMNNTMGEDSGDFVGGPLYPPLHGFFYYPLGWLAPQPAYRVMQVFCLLLVFLAGLGISRISQGRVWTSLATLALLHYPGYSGTLLLGQNAAFTLAILVWGWVLAARGRDGWAGVVWGFLAYKPVWSVSFFLVPLLTRRWRMCLTMIGTSALLCLLTLPVVGWHSWMNWLKVGRVGARIALTDQNWITLGRHLLSLPRRFLIDFEAPKVQDNIWAHVIGWGLVSLVLLATLTVALYFRTEARDCTGPVPACFFLAAWMACFQFMYYDALMSSIAFALVFAQPGYLMPLLQTGKACWHRLKKLFGMAKAEDLIQAPGWPLAIDRLAPALFLSLLFGFEQLIPWFHQWNEMYGIDGEVYFPAMGSFLNKHPWDTYTMVVFWFWCGFVSPFLQNRINPEEASEVSHPEANGKEPDITRIATSAFSSYRRNVC